jgi:hypothetical protein
VSSSRNIVFESRRYTGLAAPPAAVLEDVSRYRNNGAITGAINTMLQSTLWGNIFAGGELVTIPGNASLQPIRLTMKIWATVTNVADSRYILCHGGAGAAISGYAMLYRFTTNDWSFLCYKTGVNNANVFSGIVPVLGRWYMLAYTFDGNVGTAFINGLAVGASVPNAGNIVYIGTPNLYIGAQNGVASHIGNSALPLVFKGILSATQIYKLFQSERRYFNI